MFKGMPVVALEEHYWDRELSDRFPDATRFSSTPLGNRLFDMEGVRLEAMDRAGVDVQVLSHGAPSGQCLAAADKDIVKRVNDRLAEVCARHPKRFYGFAALPTVDPDASADELERCVKELGFKGAMIHGPTGTKFIDEKASWTIFERAEALDVPVYLHPAQPLKGVVDLYYADYVKAFPSVISAAWGFTVETATAAIRLILSGVFEKHPNAKIILGHLGETLPFLLWRINQALSRPGQQSVSFRDTFCRNFWLTSSGNFSTPALLCCMQEMGMDRLMFSIDWPFVENEEGMDWVKTLQLSPQDMRNFLGGTAQALLRL